MNKKLVGILAAAIIAVLAGVGLITSKSDSDKSSNSAEAQQASSQEQNSSDSAKIEPAADKEDAKSDEAKAEAEKPSKDNPVVAKVDGLDVLRSDVVDFISNLPPQMRQMPLETIFPMALEQVINGKIVEEKANKTDVAGDPEVSKRMEEAKAQIVRAVYMEKEIEKNLSDSRIKKAYDKFVEEQGKVEEVKASHILVDKEDLAKDLIKKIEDGAKFEDLAKEHSKDTANKSSGGDLGYFTQQDMVKEFADAAFAMKAGEVSKTPVKTQFGYHVIKVEDKRNRPVPSLDEVKPMLAAQERREILNELIESWREKAEVKTFDMNGNELPKADKADKKE